MPSNLRIAIVRTPQTKSMDKSSIPALASQGIYTVRPRGGPLGGSFVQFSEATHMRASIAAQNPNDPVEASATSHLWGSDARRDQHQRGNQQKPQADDAVGARLCDHALLPRQPTWPRACGRLRTTGCTQAAYNAIEAPRSPARRGLLGARRGDNRDPRDDVVDPDLAVEPPVLLVRRDAVTAAQGAHGKNSLRPSSVILK